MAYPSNCKYTKEHEWIRLENDNIAYVGITDFAQHELGDLVYVDVPTVGKKVGANEVFGAVEAVKTTSDLYMPVACTVLELNLALDASPELINSDPHGEGWIVKVAVDNVDDLAGLLSAEQYTELVG